MTAAASRDHVRGSSLLVVGRILSVAINFVTQIVIVRALSKSEFGVFAYALSIVNIAETAITLGLDRGITRFLPIYDERGERGKFLGTLLFVPSAILGLGVAVVGILLALRGQLASSVGDPASATAIVAILAFLAPVQAIDNLLLGIFAVLSRARAIFFRRYVMAPVLRLLVVLAVASTGGAVRTLAAGYVVAGAVGVALYAVFLVRSLQRAGSLDAQGMRIEVPYREILGFTVPLLTSDLVFVLLDSMDGVLLGIFRDAPEVAALRAVQPVARMNLLVLNSFGVLFTPIAARLFARSADDELGELYWRTAAWVAVATFPVAAVCVGAARPLTVAMFGGRYESSAAMLAVLASGYYASAALGFNGLTLNVFGRVRAVVTINVAAAVVNLALNLALIPTFGAIGAASATAITLVIHNLLRQVALARRTPVRALDPSYRRMYVLVGAALLALGLFGAAADMPLPVALVLVVVVSTAVVAAMRERLQVATTFPELMRLPFVGRFLAARRQR